MPFFPNAINWTNHPLVLYHGTITPFAAQIHQHIDLNAGRSALDFGQGFYTTTWKEQARVWARKVSTHNDLAPPCIIQFTVDRNALSQLRTLSFVRGAADAEDFWALVYHCRASHHHQVHQHNWYDVVTGPVVATRYKRRRIIQDFDQFSFHTQQAATLLDNSQKIIENVQ